jgi:hypothetical protein
MMLFILATFIETKAPNLFTFAPILVFALQKGEIKRELSAKLRLFPQL